MNDFASLLRSVFDKLYFWKECFSNKAWALEKMKDVFIREMDLNPNQIKTEEFTTFLKGFYDHESNNNLVEYPDFVMNAVSKMMTTIIMSPVTVQEQDLTLMFNLLRSAVTHGQFEKGQRVSMMFDCMKNLLVHGKNLDLMMSCQFDASLALMFAVGGKQNYTRKSAHEYFIELVKVAFNESDVDKDLLKTKALLREILINVFCVFNKSLKETSTFTSDCSLNIIANYCRILSLCSESSLEWGYALAFSGTTGRYTFNIWCDLLKHLISHKYCDIGDVAVSSVNQLALLANQRKQTKEGEAAFERLSSLIVLDMITSDCDIGVSDLIVMAHSVISRCEGLHHSFESRQILVDLSVLPLLVVLGVSTSTDPGHLHHVIEITKEQLERESRTKRSSILISRALCNAFFLAKNKGLLEASSLSSTIDYVTLKTTDPPKNGLRPFLQNGVVSDRRAFTCLISAFNIFKDIIDKPTNELKIYEAETVQMYVAPIANFPGISHTDLTTTLECYRSLLHRMVDCGTSFDNECLQNVLESLELHLVNMDPNLRDTAVRELGQLYLLESTSVKPSAILLTAKFLPSLWRCVKDKEENVVSQVFEFILSIVDVDSGNSERFKELYSHLGIVQEDLMSELRINLMSRQLENIKPVAFSLYSRLADSLDLIRYAEVCLQQSNSLAAPAVFSCIDNLFKKWTGCCRSDDGHGSDSDTSYDLGSQFEGLCNLVSEGWVDLLLMTLHGDNTTCLRYALDVLVHLSEFFNRLDVSSLVDRKLKSVVDVDRGGYSGTLELLTKKMIFYSQYILSGSLFQESLLNFGKIDGNLGLFFDDKDKISDNKLESSFKPDSNMEKDIREIGEVSSQETSIECFDHSFELQPFVLNEKPFALQHMISNVLSYSSQIELKSDLGIVLMFSGVKELLNRLPLKSMQTEVYRSTDEYDRSSITVLQDINNSLDSSFKILCVKLEKEIIEVLMAEVIEVLECLMVAEKGDVGGTKIVKYGTLTKLSRQMKDFCMSKETFSRFVLSERRKVIVGDLCICTFEVSSSFVNDGIDVFRDMISRGNITKSYYASSEGLKTLLNMYDFAASGKNLHTDSLHLPVWNSQSEIKSFASNVDLQQALETIKKSKEVTDDLISSSSSDITTETLEKKATTVLMFEFMQRILATCRQHVKTDIDTPQQQTANSNTEPSQTTHTNTQVSHSDTHQQPCKVSVSEMLKTLFQLKEDFNDNEDEYIGDNDPTTIDCY